MVANTQAGMDAGKPHELEQWKLDLALSRIRFYHFPKDDWDDILHELAVDILKFKFDPQRSNGAKESTVIFAMVDKRLKMMMRTRKRERQRMRQYQVNQTDGTDEDTFMAVEDSTPMNMDVRNAMETLTPQQQDVIRRLAGGQSVKQIASHLNCGWHTIDRIIAEVRRRFDAMGLRGWVGR
ncbi:MAG: sigma-70 family RNA polymerase sigma factor [Planctomycetes bacterium]|nr:sigma-70 family RNA polymerase sigma factor [Planctomycetota bacterium]